MVSIKIVATHIRRCCRLIETHIVVNLADQVDAGPAPTALMATTWHTYAVFAARPVKPPVPVVRTVPAQVLGPTVAVPTLSLHVTL